MNILLLEDNGTVFSYLMEELEKRGHKVECTTKISRAIDLFDNKLDCFIVDLQVNPVGLSKEDMITYEKIWGWAWLKNFVFSGDEQWKKRTIIYSGHIKELYSKVDKKDYKDVYIIEKNGIEDFNLICIYLDKIEKLCTLN